VQDILIIFYNIFASERCKGEAFYDVHLDFWRETDTERERERERENERASERASERVREKERERERDGWGTTCIASKLV
jgi:hypothetical protein